MIQDRAIITMEHQQVPIRDLSNGVISNYPKWPPNQDFKVTPLFDAEYFRNGTRYRDTVTIEYKGLTHMPRHFQTNRNLCDLSIA